MRGKEKKKFEGRSGRKLVCPLAGSSLAPHPSLKSPSHNLLASQAFHSL